MANDSIRSRAGSNNETEPKDSRHALAISNSSSEDMPYNKEPTSDRQSKNNDNNDDNEANNNNDNNDDNDNDDAYIDSEDEQEVPYTILRTNEKYIVSILLAGVGLISSLSMPIYFPILTVMEGHFHVDTEKINLSVVAYLCLQAVSPVCASSLADTFGRRPILLVCLFCATVVNIGLAVTNAYWLLVFLRCCLAASAAPTISITTACVGDWVQRHERGKYIGIVSGFTLIGQGFAPFLGAVIDVWLGWRGVFWFSALVDFIIFLSAFVFLPETKRSLIGNLSAAPLKWFNKSPIVYFYRSRLVDEDRSTVVFQKDKISRDTFLDPFRILIQTEVLCTLIPSSFMFATWNTSQTSLTNALGGDAYHLTTLKIGLCYFAPGFACILGTTLSGRLIDMFYRRAKKKYEEQFGHLQPAERPLFNLVKVRLTMVYYPMAVIILAALGFGWSLNYSINLAPILVFSFLITFSAMYPLTCSSTLLVDLYPTKSSIAMSLINLLRCGLSAILIACLDKMTKKMTYGGTYSFLAGVTLFTAPLYVYLMINSEKIVQQKIAAIHR